MFEIGFSELMLVGIVALLVFGPDKLPGLARNVGLWTGRIKRMIGSVQQDVQRELAKADELTRILEEQKQIVERLIDQLRKKGLDIVTSVEQAKEFWPAEDYHQDYYGKKGGQPYCHVPVKRF